MDDAQVDLDVENLFNEDPGLSQDGLDHIIPGPVDVVLQTPPATPSAATVQHLLELTYSGCFKQVAWSRNGHLVTISPDRSSVSLQCLRLIPGTNRWVLSEPQVLDRTFENAVTLRWSGTGVELAVIDSVGRVSLFGMMTVCLNKLTEITQDLVTPFEEQGAPVAAYWLNQDRQDKISRNVVANLTTNGTVWTQNFAKAKSFGPHYGRALMLVTKNGVLSLTYQKFNTQWQRHSTSIKHLERSTITHGAFSSTKEGRILLALYTSGGTLNVYHVQIGWPVTEWRNNINDPTQPKITVEPIYVDASISHIDATTTDSGASQIYSPNSWILTHLEIVPTTDIENSLQLPPQIWAVYASINASGNATEAGFLQSSVIRRWNLLAIEPKLHPKFDEMPTKADVQHGDQEMFLLERQPDSYQQVIVGLDLVDGGQMIAITTVDGQVDLLNPNTMSPVSYEAQPNEVTSMAQSGFSFNPVPSSIITILSPNAATAAIVNADSKLILNQGLYLGQPLQSLSMADPQQSAAASALVLALSRTVYSSSNADDVLSSIASACRQDQLGPLISRMYSTLILPAELTHEKATGSQMGEAMQKPVQMRILSFHLALLSSVANWPLQSSGFPHSSTWSRLWVWMTVNLRFITISFHIIWKELHQTQPGALPNLMAPSYMEQVVNMVKYIFDIYHFIFETILEVGDRQTNPDMFDEPIQAPLFNLGDEKGDGSQGLVALLLNCHWSRFLLANTAHMIHIIVERADPSNPNVRQIVEAIGRHSIGKGLSITAVEALLNEKRYRRAGLANDETHDSNIVAQRQIEMMSSGRVGEHFQGTIKNLLTNVINGEPGIRNRGPSGIQRLKLFTETPDLSWILLNMDSTVPKPSSNAVSSLPIKAWSPKNRKLYDIYKKSQIIVQDGSEHSRKAGHNKSKRGQSHDKNAQLIRRCVRCGSLSEDISGVAQDWPKNLMGFSHRCVCEGCWILEPLVLDELYEDEGIAATGSKNGNGISGGGTKDIEMTA